MQLTTSAWKIPIVEQGKFIVLEGIDGGGKSTAIEGIKKFLHKKDIHVVITREPGGTEIGERLRNLLLYEDLTILPETELFMMFAARIQHLEEIIYPALAQGSWVISDRFTDSSYAYQGGGGQLNINAIRELEQIAQGTFRPDLVFLLDIPVKEGLLRATGKDKFHERLYGFYERTRALFLERAQELDTHVLIDASKSQDVVLSDILENLNDFIRAPFKNDNK